MNQPKRTETKTLTEYLENGDGNGNVFATACPSRVIMNHVCSRWGLLILIALRGKTLRYSELRRTIGGVSEKMLAQSLRTLTADGFVLRTSYPVVPPYVEYNLTPLGEEVAERAAELADWIEGNLSRIMDAQEQAQQAQ